MTSAAGPLYGDVGQWLAAYERITAEVTKPSGRPTATAASRLSVATKKPKLSYRDQQEWDGMEAAITAAEKVVADSQAEVDRAASLSHAVLADACRALEQAQRTVERLYARWQELEAKLEP